MAALDSVGSLPLVDYRDLQRDRNKFLQDLRHALYNVGFLVLANAPGLDDNFQQRMFREVRGFFDAPKAVKMEAHIAKTPYFRGYTEPIEASSRRVQKIELFQYGFDEEPIADPSDTSVPIHSRLFRGPNTWPSDDALPGFRPAIEDLTRVYHKLTHELGHLIMECLGEHKTHFDKIFDFNEPSLAASLNKNWGLDEVPQELQELTRKAYEQHDADNTGAHIDGPPFIALLINDKPGLQVVAGEGRWINAPVTCRTSPGEYCVPVIPGSVVVNTGGTLMHLSKGRCVATLHRVNTTLVPPGESRVSMPYFLLPTMEGPLVPFGEAADASGTGYSEDRNRGLNAAVNRMATFPQCSQVWWKKEFKQLRDIQAREAAAETRSAYELAAARAARNQTATPAAKL